MSDDVPPEVKTAALMVLGGVLAVALVCLTVVAVATDRDLSRAVSLTFAFACVVATLAGFQVHPFRRRWRIEQLNGHDRPESGPQDPA